MCTVQAFAHLTAETAAYMKTFPVLNRDGPSMIAVAALEKMDHYASLLMEADSAVERHLKVDFRKVQAAFNDAASRPGGVQELIYRFCGISNDGVPASTSAHTCTKKHLWPVRAGPE